MGIADILFNNAELFEKNIPLRQKNTVWNLVKIGQAVSEKKTFKYYDIL